MFYSTFEEDQYISILNDQDQEVSFNFVNDSIEIELIDEQINSELADQYDYYYVPALFDGNTKLHEGVASKDGLKKIFDQYLGH